ncbi:hypothetical protein OPT61_g3151 [Boeremia exigua]|uniref:Uncharacterized protein n=1 Tax=Boeremia exigua TaxID=749465 RepID=A0ACC2IIZ0_9PLEO|nr:hypothetical protein OPT61_g3151 [Boeremia exigua]
MSEESMFQATDLKERYDPLSGHDLPTAELPLPTSFKWGTATSAYQIEGGADSDGKGPSIWDEYTHCFPSRTNNENGDVACDHYNRTTEDIELMNSFGVDVYRFSLSWSRIIPLGGRNDPINEQGIAFYNNLIDRLLARGIEPSITLYHWDLPQALYDGYKGFLNTSEFLADFLRYARLCFERFGDRVQYHFYEPYSDSQEDKHAAAQRLEFFVAWFGDPIFLGKDYPASMRAYLGGRLPNFSDEEKALLRETAHSNAFYGMNHYSTKYARALPHPPADDDWTGNVEEGSVNKEGMEIGPVSQMQWLRMAPEGFRKLLKWVWDRYHLPIIVTENGCPCPEDSVDIAVDDVFRQTYLGLYLDAISRSIYDDGIEVTGYYVWTLMDNFEWSAGFSPKYGIVHVDFEHGSLKRTPKNSVLYLRDTFKQRRQKQ